MSGRLIKISPEGVTSIHTITHSGHPKWEELKEQVGGYIERIQVKYENKVRDAYVDEDGLTKQLAPNSYAMDLSVYPHYLVGPIVIWVPDKKVKKNVQTTPSAE